MVGSGAQRQDMRGHGLLVGAGAGVDRLAQLCHVGAEFGELGGEFVAQRDAFGEVGRRGEAIGCSSNNVGGELVEVQVLVAVEVVRIEDVDASFRRRFGGGERGEVVLVNADVLVEVVAGLAGEGVGPGVGQSGGFGGCFGGGFVFRGGRCRR